MTAAQDDAAEITPPRDPATYAARRRAPPLAWIAAALLLAAAAIGAAWAVYGPWAGAPDTADPAPPPAAAPAEAAAPERRPGGISGRFQAGAADPDPALAGLEARVRALESAQAATVEAAAAALASVLLAEAAATSRPFETELAALERTLPLSADAAALRRLAETGAPTKAALAAGFDDAAAKAVVAARDPGEGAGFLARLGHALSAIVTVRRTGSAVGGGPDAVLARAERQADDGDIDGALETLRALPPAGQEAMAAWRAGAERRAEIDARVAAIRASALADLTRVARAGP